MVFYLLHNFQSTCVELDTKVRLRTNRMCTVILCRKITEEVKMLHLKIVLPAEKSVICQSLYVKLCIEFDLKY